MSSSPTLGDVIRRFAPVLCVQRRVTPAQRAVLSMLGSCRTPALGGHVHACDRCGAEHVLYNSCRSRHCPSCLGHKSAEWLDARAEELLPVPYFHVVFTLPEQISAMALGNKRLIYGLLFRAATETLSQIARDPQHLGAEIGFVAVLHTWTQTLLHHPHVHCVIPAGGLSPDGTRWISSKANFFLPVRVLSRLFRGKFLALLTQAVGAGKVRFKGSTVHLSQPGAWSRFSDEMRAKEWVVYSKPPFGSPEQVLKYLAAYTHRVAISNKRIVSMTDTHVCFRFRDRTRGDIRRTMTLNGVEFLRRFLLHILPKSFVRIRHYGFLANRSRRSKLAVCRALLGFVTDPASPTEFEDINGDDTTPPVQTNGLCPTCRVGHLRKTTRLRPQPCWLFCLSPIWKDTS